MSFHLRKKVAVQKEMQPIPRNPQVFLVGGFNPFEKYARQIGNLPQIGVKIPKIFELPPPSS